MAEQNTPLKQEALTIPVYFQVGDRLFQVDIDMSFLDAPIKSLRLGLGDEKFTEEFELQSVARAEQDKMVEQLLVDGKLSKSVKVGNIVDVEFETKSTEEILAADILPEGFEVPKGATARWVSNYTAVRTLAAVIMKYGGKSIGDTPEVRLKFVLRLPELVTDRLTVEYNQFLREVRQLLTPKVLGPAIKNS